MYGYGIMVRLHSILCKVNANSNKLFVLLVTPQFLSVLVLTFEHDNLFEMAVSCCSNIIDEPQGNIVRDDVTTHMTMLNNFVSLVSSLFRRQ